MNNKNLSKPTIKMIRRKWLTILNIRFQTPRGPAWKIMDMRVSIRRVRNDQCCCCYYYYYYYYYYYNYYYYFLSAQGTSSLKGGWNRGGAPIPLVLLEAFLTLHIGQVVHSDDYLNLLISNDS